MCLHHVVSNPNNWRGHPTLTPSLKNSLVLLIQAGADIYAKNDKGCSVSERAYTVFDCDSPCSMGHVWEEALSACGYDAKLFREEFCRRKHAVVGDLCPCQTLGGSYNFKARSYPDPMHQNFYFGNLDNHYFMNNEADSEKFQDYEKNSESNNPTFQEVGADEPSFQDTEQPFDPITHGSYHTSLQYDSTTLNSTWGGFASHQHSPEQTMDDINIWNQADSEPGEQDIEKPANFILPQERLHWVEERPDSDLGWAWDKNPIS